MHELTALVSIRARISRRLREIPRDAGIEQQLWAHFGSPAEAERRVAERTCYMVAVLALDSVPEMLLTEDARRWAYTEGALEAVAHTFAEEIAQLRVLLHRACRQVHGEAFDTALSYLNRIPLDSGDDSVTPYGPFVQRPRRDHRADRDESARLL
jgi:hypothetical protein